MKVMDADVKLLCCLVPIAPILGLFGHTNVKRGQTDAV